MKKILSIVLLVILGALPFLIGGIQNWYMTYAAASLLPYGLISFFVLLLWGCIAFLFYGICQSSKAVVISLNLIAALDLLLVGVQELILHAYWMNSVGIWSQLFYLPLLNLGFRLTNWIPRVFAAYAVGFILMTAVSFAGCQLRDKLKK